MNTSFSFPAAALLISLAACGRSTPLGTLAPEPAAELARIQRAPDQTGERIYEGRVFSEDSTRKTPLYWYDRRVRDDGDRLISTHITRDSAGEVVVTQSAEHDANYDLRRANLIQRQSGLAGSVEMIGKEARFTLAESGRVRTATEVVDAPVIAGPTTFGFIVAHWDALARGEAVPVRFAVLEMNKSIGFVLERVAESGGRTTIRMNASSWLIRRFLSPTYFYFDSATRKVVGYDGRVPPLEHVGDKLRALDARVRYTHIATVFR
jgi:hypothetical protein